MHVTVQDTQPKASSNITSQSYGRMRSDDGMMGAALQVDLCCVIQVVDMLPIDST